MAQGEAAGLAFFENRIRPVFVEHCYSCHSAEAKKVKGALKLERRKISSKAERMASSSSRDNQSRAA